MITECDPPVGLNEPDDTNELLQNLCFMLQDTKVALLVGPGFPVQKLQSVLA